MFLKSSVSLKQEIKCSRIIDFIRILYTVSSSQGSRFWGQLYKYNSKINQDFEKCRIIRNKCLKKILLLQNEIVKGFDLRLNNSIRLSRLSLEKL